MPEVTRLSWAGARLALDGLTVLLDPLFDAAPLERLGMGAPRTPLVAPAEPRSVDVVGVTHIHPDHCDSGGWPGVLRPDGIVLGPPPVAARARAAGLEARPLAPWETASFGEVSVTALPAVDGFGEEQVSWLVACGDWSLFHGGDTLWHGHWWKIVREHGSPRVALLPANGAIAAFAGMKPSPLPATLVPEQAVVAALLLGASKLVPIHYGEFHSPPVYVETPDVERRLEAAAAEHGVVVELVAPGARIE